MKLTRIAGRSSGGEARSRSRTGVALPRIQASICDNQRYPTAVGPSIIALSDAMSSVARAQCRPAGTARRRDGGPAAAQTPFQPPPPPHPPPPPPPHTYPPPPPPTPP